MQGSAELATDAKESAVKDNLDELKQRVKDNPHDATAHLDYGIALGEVHRFNEAVCEFEQVVELDPESVDGHYNLGVIYGKCLLEDLAIDELWEDHSDEEILFENALHHYKIAFDLDSTCVAALNNLGHLHAVRGCIGEAREYFLKSLEIDPDQAGIRDDLAELEE